MNRIALVAMGMVLSVVSAAEAGQPTAKSFSACSTILGSNATVNGDEVIIGALRELLIEQVISSQDLPKILNGENPLVNSTQPRSLEFRPVIDQVLEAIRGDREEILPLIQKLIAESAEEKVERNDSAIKTKIKFTQLTFYPIAPGEFAISLPDEKSQLLGLNYRQTKIDREFWIANYPVTQWQYAMVTGRNPSEFKAGPGHIEIAKISMLPNNPVEMIWGNDTNSFIKKLNDLSQRDDPLIYDIIPAHQKYWRFRRPTPREWEYVARNRGAWKGIYPDKFDDDNIDRIAWCKKNSQKCTHPVGELDPIWIDGKYPIYDLFGNVWEYTERDLEARGGSWINDAFGMRIRSRAEDTRGDPSPAIGFRLVTEPPE